MPHMSVSKYKKLRSCPRLYYWEYELKWSRIENEGDQRDFGTLFHAGLEAWWLKAGEGDVPWADEALVEALKAIQKLAAEDEYDKYMQAEAEVMMIAYHSVYFETEFTLVGNVGVEEWFNVGLKDVNGNKVDRWALSGKKDAKVHFKGDHKPMIVEHKSTTSPIGPGSPYWERLHLDMQISTYIDAAQQQGFDIDEVCFDVVRRVNTEPRLATPEAERTYTKGVGCSKCGGSGKSGAIEQGKGYYEVKFPKKVKGKIVENIEKISCEHCAGTGWKCDKETGEPQAPRLHARQRIDDEPIEEYKARLHEAIAENIGEHFRRMVVKRRPEQIKGARHNLVMAAAEIDFRKAIALEAGDGNIAHPNAKYAYPQNDQVCTKMYGRDCDFYLVCSGQVDHPSDRTDLYEIYIPEKAKKKDESKQEKLL